MNISVWGTITTPTPTYWYLTLPFINLVTLTMYRSGALLNMVPLLTSIILLGRFASID